MGQHLKTVDTVAEEIEVAYRMFLLRVTTARAHGIEAPNDENLSRIERQVDRCIAIKDYGFMVNVLGTILIKSGALRHSIATHIREQHPDVLDEEEL